MYQAPLPPEYAGLTDEQASERITRAKQSLGRRLTILGHHYQRDEVIKHADFTGDSYKLANNAADSAEAEFIVFCGVHFMAESTDILTPPRQKVILPNLAAGCSMADMANHFQVRSCWKQLAEVTDTSQIVPVTYINSAANLKAFVGEHGGTVCTSTNAPQALEWAFTLGSKVLFFPDQHLGRNTGVKMGYDHVKDMVLWDPFKPLGGNTPERIREATFILWKGHCSVHGRFKLEQVVNARREHPDVNILVHPEVPMEVADASDFMGSTEYIINTVQNAKPGTKWAIGTEINLVSRLANNNPDKTVFCLDPQICPCSTMYRIHPSFLCWALEELVAGRVMNQVSVPDEVRAPALKALEQMLRLGPKRQALAVD
jgi:quinolinate synthase